MDDLGLSMGALAFVRWLLVLANGSIATERLGQQVPIRGVLCDRVSVFFGNL